MGGRPLPASLVIQVARVAVGAAVVQLLLLLRDAQGLLACRKIVGTHAAHDLLRSQLLLWSQLPLEVGPRLYAQQSQPLRVSAASDDAR